MLFCENIKFKYNKEQSCKTVLNNISLNIQKGEFVCVLGHNGSGKSTLAKHFNAIFVPDEGRVVVDGIDTSNEDRLWDVRSKVAMVFQNPDNQIVATIVEDDVAFAAENLGIEPKKIRERVDYALKAVGMTKYKKHSTTMLSGGQKQRVAIAGVIAMKPEVIVFDEPTAMLDPNGRKEVLNTILKLNKEYNITIVLITHNMEEAVLSDRVVVMDEGNIVIDDKPQNVFTRVKMMKEIGLDVPPVTELIGELRDMGYPVSKDVLTTDECVKELLKLCL